MTWDDLRIAAVVALGGVAGTLARFAVVLSVPWHPPAIPWATLAVNLAGCAAIGALLTFWNEGSPPAWWVRPLVAVGFVGGFTTFSAFAVEGVRLVEVGAPGVAALYVVGSVSVGLLLVRGAAEATRWMLRPDRRGVR
ncbi:MAG: CrcB family protein [Actinomycetia bacterium]|nr:CrcB family protein [Actinomycetes bacterium]